VASLASVSDVSALLGETVDETRCEALLEQASAQFRLMALQDFDLRETSLILRLISGHVILPKRPVVSVETVRVVNNDGTPGFTATGWIFDGISKVSVGDLGWLVNGPNILPTETVEVTWTHGFAEVPADVRWAVAQMVARSLSSPAPAGITQESIGGYQYSLGAYTASGAASMTREEQAVASRYRPRQSSVAVL